jgi:hypothetical protein
MSRFSDSTGRYRPSDEYEEGEYPDKHGPYYDKNDIDVCPPHLPPEKGHAYTEKRVHGKQRDKCYIEMYAMRDVCKTPRKEGETARRTVAGYDHCNGGEQQHICKNTVRFDEKPVELYAVNHYLPLILYYVRPETMFGQL